MYMVVFYRIRVFIRFNPDNYRVDGVLRKTSWETRLERLSAEIERQVARIEAGENEELVEIAYLFFDEAPPAEPS